MDLSNQKEVKETDKTRNTSAEEEILHVLQSRHHFPQSGVFCVMCKSKDCVKRKAFSESNVPSVLNEKHNQCSERQSEQWLTRMFFWCKCCSNYYSQCQNPVPEIICNKNSDANQHLNAEGQGGRTANEDKNS